MSTALQALTSQLATKLNMGDGSQLVDTLKATAFKGQVSDAQMTALMVVANQYGLNPWTKEIYAFPDRNNGIVPVVGVDGWSRIINEHSQFDGMEFQQDDDSCTCIIYRKDRNHPVKVTEYMAECRRDGVGPWKSHPRRMLRHKALIQCARLAFGYTGIYDQDEAERIVDAEKNVTPRQSGVQIAEAARSVTDSPERINLIFDLEAVASDQGIDAYESAFKSLSPMQRKLLGADEHNRLKALAQAHGVIEGEVVHG
ncbi:MAG: hypothetical protein RL661_203 [Pseudomonadota bacterium]|jgi:phage recombination protein Bet